MYFCMIAVPVISHAQLLIFYLNDGLSAYITIGFTLTTHEKGLNGSHHSVARCTSVSQEVSSKSFPFFDWPHC
jgi:hypothetical protein